ncbi:MAG: hypothetical protein U0790_15860 [Isosphaeraceae bacterium]
MTIDPGTRKSRPLPGELAAAFRGDGLTGVFARMHPQTQIDRVGEST